MLLLRLREITYTGFKTSGNLLRPPGEKIHSKIQLRPFFDLLCETPLPICEMCLGSVLHNICKRCTVPQTLTVQDNSLHSQTVKRVHVDFLICWVSFKHSRS